MTTATFNYVAAMYEKAVDRDLDVTAIRRFLAEHGVRRTPAQVLHDLDTVFQFTGYADSHPAPTGLTTEQLDASIDSMSSTQVRRHNDAWEASWRAGSL